METSIKKEDFFKLGIIKKEIKIEEMGKSIYVKVMSGVERRTFHAQMSREQQKEKTETPNSMIPVLISICAVDDRNNLIFSPDDIEAIDKLPATITTLIFTEAAKINGLTQDALDEKIKN